MLAVSEAGFDRYVDSGLLRGLQEAKSGMIYRAATPSTSTEADLLS